MKIKHMKKRMMITILSLSILVPMDSIGSHRIYGKNSTYKRPSYEIANQKTGDSPEVLPSSFDLRDEGKVTPVKNQNPWGTCGTFGSIASLESNYLVQNPSVKDIDLSELQIAWDLFTPQTKESLQGNSASESQVGEGNSTVAGGNSALNQPIDTASVVSQLATWQGSALESDIPYRAQSGDSWAVPPEKRTLAAVQLKEALFLPGAVKYATSEFSQDVVDQMKKMIMKNGALATAYAYKSETYNTKNKAQYNGTIVNTNPNHEVSIVGWDDSFSQSNFNKDPGVHEGDGFYALPPGPGAWLVKNQWGTGWGDHGYFWLSYYDVSYTGTTSFVAQPLHTYDKNYQYDFIGLSSKVSFHSELPKTNEVSYANVFTIDSDEQLKAVSTTLNSYNSTVRTRIYKLPYKQSDYNLKPIPDGVTPLLDQTNEFKYGGYYTVPLKNPIDFKKGDVFSVVQTLSSTNAAGQTVYQNPVEVGARELNGFRQHIVINKNESFRIHDGKQEDILYLQRKDNAVNGNVMIKAFTNIEKAEEPAALTSFTYQPYDGKDQPIGSPLTSTDVNKDTITLPAGSASLKLTDVQATGGTASIYVKGSAYALGDKIDRNSFVKTGDSNPIKITVTGADGLRTDYSFAFTTSPLILTQGNITINDVGYNLQANTQLSVTEVTSGSDYDAVKTELSKIGGADNFVLRTINLQPALLTKETVNLSVALGAQFTHPDKTTLYYVDKSSDTPTLVEIGNTSKDPNVIQGDVNEMGDYVLAEVKAVPPLPTLSKVIYNSHTTLASVAFPNVEGGSWSWEDTSIVPTVDKTNYAAIFTPSADSIYRTYKANIPLVTEKASVELQNTSASDITYGQTLMDSILQGTAMLGTDVVPGSLTWTDPTIAPTVKDSDQKEYNVVFTPTDQVNYQPFEDSVTIHVAKKEIQATINDASKTYGDENPTFTFTLPQGALVGNDTKSVIKAALTSSANTSTGVGTGLIEGKATADNYTVNMLPGSLTIKKRPVGVMLDSLSVPYGDIIPTNFTYKLTNLVNGDSEKSLQPTVEIGVIASKPPMLAGSYELKVKKFAIVSNNYVVAEHNPSATLTITPNASNHIMNSSSITKEVANQFMVYGSIPKNTNILLSDVSDKHILDAFAAKVATTMQAISIFDLSVPAYDAPKGKLTLGIPVDAKYNGQKVTILHYVDQGKVNAKKEIAKTPTTDVYSDIPVQDGMVQIDVYSLSPFAILLPKDIIASKPNPQPKGKDAVVIAVKESPVTGDTTSPLTWLMFMLLSCTALIGIVVYKKKQYTTK